MSKIILIFLTAFLLKADDIKLEKPTMHSFYKKIETNAKVIELANQKNRLHSLISGNIERYFVKEADTILAGDPIVEISSIELSQITSDYISAKNQLQTATKNFQSSKRLYKKGLISQKELNEESIKKDEFFSKFQTLSQKLNALNIDSLDLKEPISKMIIYAKKSALISKILKPINSSITKETNLIDLSDKESLFLASYLPVKYISDLKDIEKITFKQNEKTITTKPKQILPKIDSKTKQIVIYSSIDDVSKELFIDMFVQATIHIKPKTSHLSIKKSALSFYDNDWVVFVPKKEEQEHHEEEEEEEEEEHDEHEEVMFEARVVEILDKTPSL